MICSLANSCKAESWVVIGLSHHSFPISHWSLSFIVCCPVFSVYILKPSFISESIFWFISLGFFILLFFFFRNFNILEANHRHSLDIPFLLVHLSFLSVFINSMSFASNISVLVSLAVCSALSSPFWVAFSGLHICFWGALSAYYLSLSIITSYLPKVYIPLIVFLHYRLDCFMIFC